MAYLNDNILDSGLSYANTNGDRVDICSQEPATYTEATSTYSLGNDADASVGAPQNGDVSGRKVTVASISAGSVTSSGTATHHALSYTTGTELLAAQALGASQSVTSGNTFTLTAWDIELPDPA